MRLLKQNSSTLLIALCIVFAVLILSQVMMPLFSDLDGRLRAAESKVHLLESKLMQVHGGLSLAAVPIATGAVSALRAKVAAAVSRPATSVHPLRLPASHPSAFASYVACPHTANAVRHPIFEEVLHTCAHSQVGPGFAIGHDSAFLGIRTNCSFYFEMPCNKAAPMQAALVLPKINDHYFEWITLMQSVGMASDKFVFIEIGGGWGKWAVDAFYAAVLSGKFAPADISLVIVEAQPGHCDLARQHLANNAIALDGERVQVLCKAASDKNDAIVEFPVQTGHYGLSTFGMQGWGTVRVPTITISALLSKYAFVDMLDLDIQGSEGDVITQAFADKPCLICTRVRRLAIGIHNHKVYKDLVQLLKVEHKWKEIHNFRHATTENTEYGPMKFDDGTICFDNPALLPGAAR